MPNAWLKFLKEYKAKHKGISLKDAMKKASVEYKKKKKKGSSKET